MADELGSAVLRVELDTAAFLQGLKSVKATGENFTVEFKGIAKGIDDLGAKFENVNRKVQSFKQISNQIPGASYSKITSQINKLRDAAGDLNFKSKDYLDTLQRIAELEFVRQARAGRQQAAAGAAAFGGDLINRGFGADLPALPNTIAGQKQLIYELRERLENLDVSSKEFTRTQEELATATDRLNLIQETSDRQAVRRNRNMREETRLAQRRRKEQNALVASQRKDLQGRVSSGLIGGAFPLLFGQGPGAAIGGAFGGAIGGGPLGFAASLVGTVIGQSVDQLVQGGADLATALKDPVRAFGVLQEQSALSSKALEKYAGSLIATGQNAEAAALIQLDALRFGDVSNLEDLANAQDELGRSFAVLGTAMANVVAGPLARFIEKLNETIKKGPTAGADGLPEFSDQLEQLKRAQNLRQQGMGLAIGGSAAGLIPGLGLFGGLLAGIGGLQVLFANMIEPDMVSDLDEFLKITHKIATARKDINKLSKIEVELIKGANAERTKELKQEAARTTFNKEIREAGDDIVRIAEAKRNLDKENAQIEAEYRAASLAAANREIARIEKLNAAYGRLTQTQMKLANVAVFGETPAARTQRGVEANVASARLQEVQANAAVNAAQKRLLNAQLYGTSEDVAEASNAIKIAMKDAETASVNVKLALQEGAASLVESLKSSAEKFRDATRSLRDLRLGNLRFLPAKQRDALVRSEVERAKEEATRRGVTLRSPEDAFAFNRFVENEQKALQTRADAGAALADANNALKSEVVTQTGVLTQLTTVMANLIDKSWTVYVDVPSQNAAAPLNMANQLN